MQAIHSDPTTGTTTIVLRDGVKRTLRFDFHALFLAEQIAGKPFSELTRAASLSAIRALLYSGLFDDAAQRGEEWTPEIVEKLIALKDLARITQIIVGAVMAQFNSFAEKSEGESQASI